MKISPTLLAVTLSAFWLAGCHTRTASYLPQETTKYSIENTEKFARLDQATQTAITCTGLQERLNQDGRLEVVANVKNRASSNIQVRVRCVFKDANGFTTGDETAWQMLTLADEATEAVHFTAINALAHTYTVVVRSP
jgi:uncharacterized protein YcfL